MFPLVPLSETVSLPTYSLIISLIYCVGVFWLLKRSGDFELDRSFALDLALAIMLGGLFGARLFHVVYEQPAYYWDRPGEIFKLWQGGFVFYGGAIGALIASLALAHWRKQSFWLWADVTAPLFAGGYAVGRLACFLNGCCYGGICELPWGLHFPSIGEPLHVHRHPTQLYATTWEFGVLMLLLVLERRKKFTGQVFLIWAVLHAAGRLLMEYFRDDDRGPTLLSLSVSSWISLLILVAAFGFLYLVRRVSPGTDPQ